MIDPSDGFDAVADLLLKDGLVAGRDEREIVPPEGTLVLEARGLVLAPGFIDLHTHLRFPGFPDKETIASGTSAAAAGGFTTVCAMANTNPVVDSVETLEHVLLTARQDALVHVHQLGAVSIGLAGERLADLPRLARAGAIAFSDDGKPVWNAEIMRRALASGDDLDRPVSAHEEDHDVVRGGVANAGPVARRLGLPEWPCSGEASMVARDVRLLQETGGRLHIAHVSCADSLPFIREARERGLRITAEVTPHHLRLTDALLEGDAETNLHPAHPCTKVNPPLRSSEDTAAMVAALADGTIDAIATDHAPHSAADKALPFDTAAFGFTALETALPLALDLVREGRISLPSLIERLTSGPARAFGLDSSVRPGARADVCVFDPREGWTVTAEALQSQGKNTPLLNRHLVGRVRWTVVEGRIVHGSAGP